ncbi:MAG: hypothetical protein WD557_05135 [Dehalococcoidia bacterium]
MRTLNVRLVGLAAAAAGALATVAIVGGQAASGWDLSWNAITGGGGKSGGGSYQLQGAVIPIDGRSQGGSYVVTGGFFAGDSVEFNGFVPAIARDGIN